MHGRNTIRFILTVSLLITLVSEGAPASSRNQNSGNTNNSVLPSLTLYTNGFATGPQLALWQAIKQGRIQENYTIQVKWWQDLDELYGTLLAGAGDFWVGHTDIFVKAALQGAPIQLLLTTGWRKFYLVSTDTNTLHIKDFKNKSLAVTPPGSPAVPILRALADQEYDDVSFVFEPPLTLLKKLIQGQTTAALLPEPLVTRALSANPRLVLGENVAELYTKQSGYLRGMPIAGIAVNRETARTCPEIIAWIAKETMKQARILAPSPQQGVDDLPQAFQALMPRDVIEASLQREQLDAAYSYEIKSEIEAYMKMILSGSKDADAPLPARLFWQHQ